MLKRIVSGGQTGVDRGALDAALEAGLSCGGWCPVGRLAEDGPIPLRYPVTELARGHYRQRTIQNIVDSDGTLIVYRRYPEGGTEQTLAHCMRKARPYRLLDAEVVPLAQAVDMAQQLIDDHEVDVLNVAGPRASKWPGGADYTRELVAGLLERAAQGDHP